MRYLPFLLVALSLTAAPPERWKDPSPDQLAAIDKAASQVKLRVTPAKPAKLLMATYAQGFWHGSIPHGAKALELIAAKTGAFTITRAEDPSEFTAANLANYDAIIVNNVTGIDRWITDEASRKAFIDFVNKGGGLFANHSASDGGWKEYSDLLGGRFAGHPWGAGGTWGFQVEEPKNLLAAAFNQQQFTLADEIYMLKDNFSRDTHRVLVSLDLSHPGTDAMQSKGSRPDRDYPVTLIRRFGEGRVFYSVFGHREDIHSNPTLLQHYTDGLQYVLGDLKIDDSPTGLWERLARYNVGRSHEVEQKVLAVLSPEVEPRFHEILTDDSTADAKIFVIDHLPKVWTAKSLPVLAGLLGDDSLNARAIEALRHGTAKFANDRSGLHKTLRDALATANDSAKVPILNALGHERDEAAIPAVAKLANSANQAVANAAILALGDIGSAKALPALRAIKGTKAEDALLRIAEQQNDASIYASLSEARPAAAFQGLVRTQGGQAIPTLVKALRGEHAVAAINALAKAPDSDSALAEFSARDSAQLLALVTAWRSRGGNIARAQLRGHAGNDDVLVASEAFRALGVVGEVTDLTVLIAGLNRKDDAADVAMRALANFGKPGTDKALIDAIGQNEGVAEVLGERRSTEAAAALMRARKNEDSGIARAAWKALANCATPAQLPELLAGLRQADSRTANYSKDVLLPLKDSLDIKVIAGTLGDYSSEGRAAVLEILGHIGSADALPALRQYIAESAALKALARWETIEPLPDLLKVANSAESKSAQVLSLRAYAAILGRVPDLEAFEKGFAASKNPESTIDLLTAIASFGDAAASDLAAGYLDDESANIAAAAWRAVTEMQANTGIGGWKFDASHNPSSWRGLIDGKARTRWSTNTPKKPGMWVSIDFGKPTPIRKIVLDNSNKEGASRNDIPQAASLQVSDNGKDWKALPSTFESGVISTFTADGHARHVKVHYDGDESKGNYWSIHELYVNQHTAAAKLEAVPAGDLTVTASDRPNQAAKAIDDNDRSAWQSDGPVSGDEWYEVSFAEPRRISRVLIDTARKKEEAPKNYAIQVSLDGERWSPQLLADKGSSKVDLSLYPASIKKLRVLQTGRDSKRRWSICELKLWELK